MTMPRIVTPSANILCDLPAIALTCSNDSAREEDTDMQQRHMVAKRSLTILFLSMYQIGHLIFFPVLPHPSVPAYR